MNILGFIEEHYPIKDRIRERLTDPRKRIAESDDLPYDVIGPDENGIITKLVEIDDNRFVSVDELIGYSREELLTAQDPALLEAYDAYMAQIDLTDLNILDILECARTYKAVRDKKKEQYDVLSVQKV